MFDFSSAKAHLVASVNGRFKGDKLMKFGQNRLGNIIQMAQLVVDREEGKV